MNYTLADTDLLSTSFGNTKSSLKQYTLKVRDLPNEDKPREKLVHTGTNSLSLAELLAIVLQTGTKNEDVLQMTKRIIREYGNIAISNETNPEKIAQDLNIPLIKACQVVSCVEIGRRLFKKNDMGLAVIRNAHDAFEFLTEMRSLPKEQLCGLYLDTHNRVIHNETISIGTINSSIVHPREVFKPALEYGAASVVLVHNHPSGILEPSQSDILITKQLVEAGKIIGIHLMDHIIVSKQGFVSIQADYE
jgi:DNA repair protein RadC